MKPEDKKTTESQSELSKDKRKAKKGLNKKTSKKPLCSPCLRGKKSVDQIVDDFADRVMKGEKLAIDDILNQYPKLANKLKPLLEAEMALILAGQEFRKQTEKEFEAFKDELWQKLEKKIMDKEQKKIESQVALLKIKQTLPIKFRAEFIPMLLYVKGKTHRIGEGIRGITRFVKLLFLLDRETHLGKLVKVFYEFVPYKIGPFEPAIYQDLKVMETMGIIKKQIQSYPLRSRGSEASKIPVKELEIDEGFNQNNLLTLYTLTDEGMKYAKALIDWLDKKDPDIALQLRRYKTYYAQAPLKKLLEYIYRKYPDYTTESEIIKDVLK